MRSALAVFLTFLTLPAFPQNPSSTTFRLVTPHSTGSILIDHSGDWKLERMVIYDNGQRPVVQLSNAKLGIIASYILDDEPHYNDTTEMCRNDVLNGIMKGALSKSTVKNKQSGARTLPNGLQMLTASYLVEKLDGVDIKQQRSTALSPPIMCAR